MSQQKKQPGSFNLRKGRGKRVEPEGGHSSRDEQNGPPSGGAQPSPNEQNGPPSGGAQPSPPEGNEVQPAESHDLPEDSSSGNRSSLGEGEGRDNVLPDKEFREQNDALRIDNGKDEEASQLKPVTVDLHKDENREAHKTDDYEIQELILRRGQVFDVTVTFNRDYNQEDDIIVVQFVTGKRPQESKGSIVRVASQDNLNPKQWGMQVKEANGSTVRLSIMSSAKAIIGRYEMFIETKHKESSGEESLFRYKHDEQICVLFNAWCSEDAVYMDNDEHRNEYVMEDFGYIWKGVSGQEESIPWTFGQFEDVSLNCALWLLDKAELSCIARSSPIHVVRTISAMANSNDKDGGILSGRWSNSFPSRHDGAIGLDRKYCHSGRVLENKESRAVWTVLGVLWASDCIVTSVRNPNQKRDKLRFCSRLRWKHDN
ncbi:hypothetical protein ACROYT_G007472 [Oculina patagonica]